MQDQSTTGNFDSQYDEIDESFMTLRVQNVKEPSTNITIIDESVSLTYKNREEHHAVSSDYLTPISGNDDNIILSDYPDTEVVSEVEIPECRRRPESAVSDYLIPVNVNTDSNVISRDSSPTSNGQSDDYLHPYTSLVNTLQRDALTADVHKDDQVTSEIVEEDNDHKYSHLYEQLRHDLIDRCPMYMLQSFPLQQDISYGTTDNISTTEISSTIKNEKKKRKEFRVLMKCLLSTTKSLVLPVEEKHITAKGPLINNI
ncbi:unnamed protein product [Mytilus edulis]|uniref:Uncharacterized protein n=1 Tax=Mytilus edulis TaxID=6550 RepID=A0A8S3PYM7_MYTED|nr:unnamed protein product [Mytilus edulis]